ncbi:hypothetical protein M9Y10_013168 [Tritrichomonas musculus]|uniref:Uncharacterized protein n=1 Tax=Tritrichomonas musculus TaxID=1915356 RepID=A0ABR2I6A4_9EUKA
MTPGGIIWLPEGEKPPETAKNVPNDPQIMVTIFLNPNGLQVIYEMKSGQRFNSSYFIERILKKLH